ncbi:hypothetical protein CRE_01406 [Caenorhabditis remanei]|uniref:Urocanase C-terminal domain-containing protein n=1 Tax=Caenorhabditis remanei TaxID=31234 RepID=E3NJ62_CAERE|nr:hypothetical protein CRE_01406 [Caenorhabditis remanei]
MFKRCYPSYMQDIMGDIFSMGFGPFRWVCTSGKPEDLRWTDLTACNIIDELKDTSNMSEILSKNILALLQFRCPLKTKTSLKTLRRPLKHLDVP